MEKIKLEKPLLALIIISGITMKLMGFFNAGHLPLSIFAQITFGSLAFLTYLYSKKSKIGYLKITFSLLLVSAISDLFKIMRWPGSSILIIIGIIGTTLAIFSLFKTQGNKHTKLFIALGTLLGLQAVFGITGNIEIAKSLNLIILGLAVHLKSKKINSEYSWLINILLIQSLLSTLSFILTLL